MQKIIYILQMMREKIIFQLLEIECLSKKKKPNKEKLKNWQSSFNNFTFRLNQVGYSSLAFLTIMNSLESPLPAKKTNPTSYDSSLASSFFCQNFVKLMGQVLFSLMNRTFKFSKSKTHLLARLKYDYGNYILFDICHNLLHVFKYIIRRNRHIFNVLEDK